MFYREVAQAPLGNAFRYYLCLSAVLALFSTIVFSIILVPQGVRFMRDVAPSLVVEHYPVELVMNIDKGEASVNVSQPYVIAGKGDARVFLQDLGLENMLVIDTTKDFNKKTFEEYKTLALLTKTDIITRNDQGQTTIQSLQGLPKTIIDQTTLLGWVEKMRAMLVYVMPIGILATFIVLFMGYVIYLIPLLLFALIPLLLAWIKKMPLTYGEAYRMSLYAIVPGLVLKTLLNVSGFFFVPAALSLLVFALVIFLNMREPKQPTLFN